MSSLVQSEIGVQRVALYSRVSSEDQAERGTIESQREFLRSFARLYQLDVASEYADDGFSGTLPLGARPDGQRLLEDAAAGRFGTILVYRLDRLARSLPALLEAHTTLESAGVTIRSATEPFDTSTPIGRFVFQLLGSLAELDRSTILERMTLGRDRLARQGRWTSGPVPFGYDLDSDGHLTPSVRLVEGLNLPEATVLRQVFERIAGGSSATAEAAFLNAMGVPSLRRYAGGKIAKASDDWKPSLRWGASKVAKIVRNPVYTGRHVFKSRNGDLEREVVPLVSADLWQAAQEQLTLNRSLTQPVVSHEYLLRGLIRCARCGRRYAATVDDYPATGAHYFYYRCASAFMPSLKDKCPAKAIRSDWLDDQVWRKIQAFLREPGPALERAQQALRGRLALTSDADDQIRTLQHALAGKEGEKERVLTLFRRGIIELADAENQLGAVQVEASDLRARIDALRSQETLAEVYEAQFTDAMALLRRLQKRVDEAEHDFALRRRAAELLVLGISAETIVDEPATETRRAKKRTRVTVTYRFPTSDALRQDAFSAEPSGKATITARLSGDPTPFTLTEELVAGAA